MFKNLRIKDRLKKSFSLVALIASISGVVAVIAMIVLSNRYSYALENYGFAQGTIGKAQTAFSEARSATRGIIGYQDADAIAKLVTTYDSQKELCISYMKEIESTNTSADEIESYNNALAAMDEFWELDAQVMEMGNTTDPEQSLKAQEVAIDELAGLYTTAYNHLMDLMDTNVTKGNELKGQLLLLQIVLLVLVAGVIICAMIVSGILGNKISEGIGAPINALAERLKTFAAGDLKGEFPVSDSEDEVTEMIEVAREMAKNLSDIIIDCKYRLGEMSRGDYTVESKMTERYVGDFTALNTSIHEMNMNMNSTLHQIEEASDQVSAGSTNLAEASQSLAEGATEQAGAVEELVATITNITDGVTKTSEHVDDTRSMSLKYAEEASHCKDEMQEMKEAMKRISDTSQKIEGIIVEIEEIASQTNLLSLNASIEAARAGEAGRGFAVVASQIGKLAEESAQSAVNTRQLITNAISEVASGTETADRTAAVMDEVVLGINNIANDAAAISELTKQQTESMRQAEAGVNQISEVIQSNSATAEESSATSEELSAEAISMDALIKKFKLKAE